MVNSRVPDLLMWVAHENRNYGCNHVKNEATPDADVCSNKHEQITFPGGDEDLEILQENGELDEEDNRAIDNCHHIRIPKTLSV